jgi:hypothetical protein
VRTRAVDYGLCAHSAGSPPIDQRAINTVLDKVESYQDNSDADGSEAVSNKSPSRYSLLSLSPPLSIFLLLRLYYHVNEVKGHENHL